MIPIQDNPVLNLDMEKLRTVTPAHADVFNVRDEQFLNNDKSNNDKSMKLDQRLTLLELMFSSDITGNPFIVSFETLDDVDVSGSWNVDMRRIEF